MDVGNFRSLQSANSGVTNQSYQSLGIKSWRLADKRVGYQKKDGNRKGRTRKEPRQPLELAERLIIIVLAMARKLSEAYSSPNTTSINLTQLLSRLESNILSPSADLKPLLRSQYHRARVGAVRHFTPSNTLVLFSIMARRLLISALEYRIWPQLITPA